jgi:uracil-DNA glycosylase
MLCVLRSKEQRDCQFLGCPCEFPDSLAPIVQLSEVSLFKPLPSRWITPEPFPQPRARRDFLKPFIDARIFFREPTWPDPIDEYAPPIGFGRLIVNAFEPNAHARLSCYKSHSVACIKRFDTTQFRAQLKIMSADSVEKFIRLLKESPPGAVFNPWWEVDQQNDISQRAPAIRRQQLRTYFRQRLGKARVAVVGEALGYRGGHFSGIPMTSERILLGKKKDSGVEPTRVFSGVKPRRTSKPQKCRDGFSEPTATIVWSTLLKLGFPSEQFVLWNAFPWHSFDPRRSILSNRTPTKKERGAGLPVLRAFLDLFPCGGIIALGNVAASQLTELNVQAVRVRHPASGGAKLFRQQISRIVNKRY